MNETGYDPELLLTHIDILCPICKMIPRNPYECSKCSTIFCEKCINGWLKQKNQCINKCPSKNIREAGLALKRVIKNLDIRCGECGKILRIDEYDKHINQCSQPKCCNDACNVVEAQMEMSYPVNFQSKPNKKACSLLCKYVALLSESMSGMKEDGSSTYMIILKKATSLIGNILQEKDDDCDKRIRTLVAEQPRRCIPIATPLGQPGKNGLWESTLDMHFIAQAIVLNNNNKSAFLSEPGYCFRTAMGNTPMISGVYYWEIHGDPRTENELKIGITSDRDFNYNTVAFCDYDFGWAFYGLGQLRHGNNSSGPKFGKPFKNVGNLGIQLDMNKGQLNLALNGELMGTAFNDEKLKKGPYFIAVSLLHKAGFSLVTGKPLPSCFPK